LDKSLYIFSNIFTHKCSTDAIIKAKGSIILNTAINTAAKRKLRDPIIQFVKGL